MWGNVPPVVSAVKDTGELTVGFAGRKVELVDKGRDVTTVIVLELVAVCVGVEESVAVSVTAND